MLVARLRAAGAIVAGKTNVPEMGAGANTRNPVWGATGNPFDPNLNAGGSSGGSAAALALDMLPLCTGSDTGGSLRIPAAKCGVVGFRPSPGVVPSVAQAAGLDADLGGRPDGPHRGRRLPAVGGHGRPCIAGDPLSYPLDPQRLPAPQRRGPVPPARGWTEDFGVCAVDDAIRAAPSRARSPRCGTCSRPATRSSFDLGEAHRCFDVLRAEAFVAGMREAYERDPAEPGAQPARQLRNGRRA